MRQFARAKVNSLLRRGQRGNVLIMAMCICVFVFFLAVALTAQNRQTILLALTEDHRVRADNAANAALNVALHKMRTNPAWESSSWERSGALENGGNWEITSIDRLADWPYVINIAATGISSMVKVTRNRLVEEIRMSKDPLLGANYIFALDDQDNLNVLNPDFIWSTLGLPPVTSPQLRANEGPLFSNGPMSKDLGPTIDDMNTPSPKIEAPSTLSTLRLLGDTFAWDAIPSSNQEHLVIYDYSNASSANGSALNSTTVPNKLYRFQEEELKGVSYTGPSYDWYNQEGNGLYAQGKRVYCHAIHYFFLGSKSTLTGKSWLVTRPGKLYQAPAVLCYNLEDPSWSVINDQLQVVNLSSSPIIKGAGQPLPNTSTLAVINDTNCYAFMKTDNTKLLKASSSGWSAMHNTSGASLVLDSYKDKLIYLVSTGHSTITTASGNVTSMPTFDINQGTTLAKDLSWSRPEIKSYSQKPGLGQALKEKTLLEAVSLKPSLYATQALGASAASGSTCACGDDLYSFIYIGKRLVLGHYDGEHWQVWPNGLHDLMTQNNANNVSTINLESNVVDAFGRTIVPRALAAARYEEEKSSGHEPGLRLNRYSVLVDTP